jgi:hypothetical protein
MKRSTSFSVLGAVATLFVAGLLICHFVDINLWWALGFAAAGLLGPVLPILDYGSKDEASSGFDA